MSYKNKIFHSLLFLLGLGLIYSTVLQSISIFLIGIFAFIDIGSHHKDFYIKKDLGWLKGLRKQIISNGYIAFILLFLYIFVGNYACDDCLYLLERVKIKLPFLILPFAFLAYDKISLYTALNILLLLLLVIIISSSHVFITYMEHPGMYEATLKRGGALDTPGNHIRFSSLLSLTVLTIVYLKSKVKQSSLMNWISILLLLLGILFLHYLSVRSGLLIFYTGLSIFIVGYCYLSKNYKYMLWGFIGMIMLPILFYNLSTGFKNKVNYMLYDINQYKAGQGALYADSGRLVSLDVGYKIWKESPMIGHGICNIRPLVYNRVVEEYPGYPYNLMPHNQFLFILIGNGIVGLLIFLFGYIYPFYNLKHKNTLAIMLFVCFTLMLFIDHLFEGTVGVCMFLFFILLTFRLRIDESDLV